MKKADILPNELKNLKNPIKTLYYKGDYSLLKRKKISIVGSRKAFVYTKNVVFELAKKLSDRGVCIVSGAAMGVDRVAHEGAGYENTIAVMGNSLDIRYPAVNESLIRNIEKNGLCISQFEPTFYATPWSFVLRNELVVALGDIVIIAQADPNSGSIRSAEFAKYHKKDIYVLPHRLNESKGTLELLKNGEASEILDIDEFVESVTKQQNDTFPAKKSDEFWEFCSLNPAFEEAVKIFGQRVYEAELSGEIAVKNGRIVVT